MAPSTLWTRFRSFRRIVLALAAILSLAWSVIIAVYIANNFSSYNSGQRGFLFGLLALDFVGSILLYLMIVVQYQFWPDAARAIVLLGLYAAGAVVFMILSPKFPCSAFGSTANCHIMTMVVLIGTYAISALMLIYAICLPVMAFVPRTPSSTQADDLENRPNIAEVNDDLRKSHASSASHAWLLKNQEGMSPDHSASELPFPPEMPAARRLRSNASSLSSLQMAQQATGDERIELEPPRVTSVYSDASSPSSIAKTIRAPDDADRSLNAYGPSSPGQYLRHQNSIQSSSLPNRFVGEAVDANRDSVASSFYGSTYEFPTVSEPLSEVPHRTMSVITGSSASVYSQSTITARANTTPVPNGTDQQSNLLASPSMSRAPHLSVHSMMASVHDHAEDLSAAGSNPTTFEFHHSDVPRRDSKDKLSDFPRDVVRDPAQLPTPVRPGLQHVRTDSTNSNVNLNDWRRLVLSAAGRE